jgi:4-amino-4-deoxy-L-arabinose transferase-like glycosyltransferase
MGRRSQAVTSANPAGGRRENHGSGSGIALTARIRVSVAQRVRALQLSLSARQGAHGRVFVACLLLLLLQYGIFSLVSSFAKTGSHTFGAIAHQLYGSLSYSLSAGEPTRFRPPAYPMLLAAAVAISPDHWGIVARLLQAAIGVVSLLLVDRIAWNVFSDRRICLVGLLLYTADVALHKDQLAQRETVLIEFLTLLFVACAVEARTSRRRAAAAAVAGLAFLTRPTGLPLLLALLTLVIVDVPRLRAKLAASLLCVGVFAAVLLPWHLYQLRTFGTFSFADSNGGVNLFKGNSRLVAPIYPAVDVDEADPYVGALLGGQTELAGDAMLRRRAVEEILADPGAFALRSIQKILLFFSPVEVPFGRGSVSPNDEGMLVVDGYRARLDWKAMLHFPLAFVVLPLGLLAMARSLRRGGTPARWGVLCCVIIAATVALYAVTFAQLRYRLPFDGLFCVGAACILCEIFRGRTRTS